MLEKVTPTKLPCAVAPTEWRALGLFPSSVRLWRQAACILLVLFILTLCVHIASAQTVFTNGANQAGTLLASDLDSWAFTANAGDSINLRVGTTSFYGKLQLYGPNGALLSTTQNSTDDLISYTPTN